MGGARSRPTRPRSSVFSYQLNSTFFFFSGACETLHPGPIDAIGLNCFLGCLHLVPRRVIPPFLVDIWNSCWRGAGNLIRRMFWSRALSIEKARGLFSLQMERGKEPRLAFSATGQMRAGRKR